MLMGYTAPVDHGPPLYIYFTVAIVAQGATRLRNKVACAHCFLFGIPAYRRSVPVGVRQIECSVQLSRSPESKEKNKIPLHRSSGSQGVKATAHLRELHYHVQRVSLAVEDWSIYMVVRSILYAIDPRPIIEYGVESRRRAGFAVGSGQLTATVGSCSYGDDTRQTRQSFGDTRPAQAQRLRF